jgi:hypothetical protein
MPSPDICNLLLIAHFLYSVGSAFDWGMSDMKPAEQTSSGYQCKLPSTLLARLSLFSTSIKCSSSYLQQLSEISWDTRVVKAQKTCREEIKVISITVLVQLINAHRSSNKETLDMGDE